MRQGHPVWPQRPPGVPAGGAGGGPRYDNATIDPAEAAKRLDLRGIPIFTIDSAETKDIDDAISLQKLDDGYELGVHIADVSHYVRPGTALNEEAFRARDEHLLRRQGHPDAADQLSNGICSLNEGEDRLAFSCLMRLDENGEIRSYKFVKSVICSRVKGVYKEINALLEPPESETDADLTELKTKYEAVLDQLPTMDELYRKRWSCARPAAAWISSPTRLSSSWTRTDAASTLSSVTAARPSA